MSKGNVKNLADQKRKVAAKKQAKNKPKFEIIIKAYENEDISVDGAIADPILFMKIMAGALNAVVDFHYSNAVEQAKKIEQGEVEEKRTIILPSDLN